MRRKIMSNIKTGKDFWSGIMFLCFAAVGIFAARNYSMGTSGKMGPGYFPVALAILLGALGLLLVVRSIVSGDERVERMKLLPLFLLIVGVVAFGAAIEPLGLVIALATTVVVSAFASRESGPLEIAALAIALAAFSVGIFHYLLLLPLPIWPAL
jgi:hypothetical protein